MKRHIEWSIHRILSTTTHTQTTITFISVCGQSRKALASFSVSLSQKSPAGLVKLLGQFYFG